jgi:hypothetical protein
MDQKIGEKAAVSCNNKLFLMLNFLIYKLKPLAKKSGFTSSLIFSFVSLRGQSLRDGPQALAVKKYGSFRG